MQTQTTTNTPNQNPDLDIVRRGVKRVLPCKLNKDEFMEISKTRVAKEALLEQLEGDLAKETKKRKEQIAELEDEIKKMGRELHTEEQDRTVTCNEVFRRADDGTGYIHTIRMDTGTEVEKRPATPLETQRHLPTEGMAAPNGSVLDQARTAQGATNGANGSNGAHATNGAVEPDEVKPEDMDDDDDEDTDGDGKPKRKAKKGK